MMHAPIGTAAEHGTRRVSNAICTVRPRMMHAPIGTAAEHGTRRVSNAICTVRPA